MYAKYTSTDISEYERLVKRGKTLIFMHSHYFRYAAASCGNSWKRSRCILFYVKNVVEWELRKTINLHRTIILNSWPEKRSFFIWMHAHTRTSTWSSELSFSQMKSVILFFESTRILKLFPLLFHRHRLRYTQSRV